MQDKRRSHVVHKRKEGEVDTLAQLEGFFFKISGRDGRHLGFNSQSEMAWTRRVKRLALVSVFELPRLRHDERKKQVQESFHFFQAQAAYASENERRQ